MKISQIFTILFLASLVLFIPLSRPEEQYNLVPKQEKYVVVNVQNTELTISSNRPDEKFDIQVEYLDPESNIGQQIQSIETVQGGEISFKIDKRGYYLIYLYSVPIITITITTSGIPDTSIFIVSLMMALAIGGQIQKQFSRSFDY